MISRDAVTSGNGTLVLAGDHSRSSSGQGNSHIHYPSRAGRGATIAEGPGGAYKESGTCDSSDDDIVRWIPKRMRVVPVGSASAKRQRRRTHIAEPASRPAQRHKADFIISSRPTSRHIAAAPSRPQNTITPTSTSTQEEWPVPPRFESEPTWEVRRIVGSARRHGEVFYKVQWEPTWEPAESLQGSANAAVAEFRLSNRRRRVCWSKSGSKQGMRSFRIRT